MTGADRCVAAPRHAGPLGSVPRGFGTLTGQPRDPRAVLGRHAVLRHGAMLRHGADLRHGAVLRPRAAAMGGCRRAGWRQRESRYLGVAEVRDRRSGRPAERLAKIATSQAGHLRPAWRGDLVYRTWTRVARPIGAVRRPWPRHRRPWRGWPGPWPGWPWRGSRRAAAVVAAIGERSANGLGPAGAAPARRPVRPTRPRRDPRVLRMVPGRGCSCAWQARDLRLTSPRMLVGNSARPSRCGYRIPGARDRGVSCPVGIRGARALSLPSRGTMSALPPIAGVPRSSVPSRLRSWCRIRVASGCGPGVRGCCLA
jgi:hypothetical protein